MATLHQTAAQLPNRHEGQRRKQENDRKEEEQDKRLNPVALLHPHGQLLAEWIHAKTVRRRQANQQDETELRREKRNHHQERNASPRGERITEAQACKTCQKAEVFVEREKFQNRGLPADQRQLEKKAERRRDRNGQINLSKLQGIEKMRLCDCIGIEVRLELPQPVVERPGGNQGYAHEHGAAENNGLPRSSHPEPGCEGAFR